MAIPREIVEEVLQRADIVDIISSYINVIKKGRSYVAICPFHDDKNPSMMIAKDKQIFKCFVCGTGGNAITFVQKYLKISFDEAVKKVAELVNYDNPLLHKYTKAKKVDENLVPLYNALEDLTKFYQYSLSSKEGEEAYKYLESRHLDADIRSKFRLGYALQDGKATISFLEAKKYSLKTIENIGISNNVGASSSDRNAGRVIFPLFDNYGKIIGFSARRLVDNDEAKYVNSPETPLFHKSSVMYNYHNAKESAHHDGYVYVLEGFMDVFALYRIGIKSAVAIMGTSLTKEHAEMLKRLNCEVRLCLDGDKPGQMATMKATKILDYYGIAYRIVDNLNNESDPDEILNDKGADALNKYLNTLLNKMDFALNYYKRTNPLSTIEERKKLVANFIPMLCKINSRLELSSYISKLAEVSQFDKEAISELINEAKKKKSEDDQVNLVSKFHPERKVLRRFENAENMILYQMLGNEAAIKFYEEKIEYFYNDVYRTIANYLIESVSRNNKIDLSSIINDIETSDISNREKVINELIEISLQKQPHCSESLLEDCRKVIEEERIKINERDILDNSMKGKDEVEKARILADYVRNKNAKKGK